MFHKEIEITTHGGTFFNELESGLNFLPTN
jgi:hypothetical protein